MVDFIIWVFDSFTLVISTLTGETINLINNIFVNYYQNVDLWDMNFDLSLFSDTPILSINFYDFLVLFFSIFYTVIFVVIVWKIIKKVFVKITRWNKW